MAPTDQNKPLKRIDERELEALKWVTVHPELAIAAALDYCATYKIDAPAWLIARAAELMRDLLKRERPGRRGRGGNAITRYRNDQWDFERMEAVEEVRRLRERVSHELKELRTLDRKEFVERRKYRERQMAWFKSGTFECASKLLAGRDARVSSDGMRASYRRCKRRAVDGLFEDRYHLFDQRFLVKLGFPTFLDRKPGTKSLHLFDLT
jgi:hypothetical protein